MPVKSLQSDCNAPLLTTIAPQPQGPIVTTSYTLEPMADHRGELMPIIKRVRPSGHFSLLSSDVVTQHVLQLKRDVTMPPTSNQNNTSRGAPA